MTRVDIGRRRRGAQPPRRPGWRLIRRLLPRGYRDRYGDQLLAHHAELNGGSGARFWFALAWDTTLTGLATRTNRAERRRHAGSGPNVPKPRSPRLSDMIERIASDLRLAARNLLRNPLFSISAALTLAVGIGANVAVFSVVYGVLMQPLPYPDPDELVYLRGTRGNEVRGTMAYPNLVDLRDTATTLRVAAYTGAAATLLDRGPARQISGAQVTANYLDIAGARPSRGRLFVADDAVEGAGRTIVVSHEAWLDVFGGDPEIVGASITLDDEPAHVVGITEPGFSDPYNAAMHYWETPAPDRGRSGRSYNGFARLARGVTLEQAQQEIDALMAGLAEAHPDDNDGRGAMLVPARELIVGPVRPTLIVFAAAVGLVLLIVCANVANLFLSRATARERDLAVRRVLGAGGGALAQQLAVESFLLTAVGGSLGIMGAALGTNAIVDLAASQLPRSSEIGLNVPVLAFAVAVSVLSALLFGLAPALVSGRGDMAGTLRATGQHGGAHSGVHRLRHALVVAEFALTMVLLVGAGLLINSLERLQSMEMGVDTSNVLTFRVTPSFERHPEGEPLDLFFRELTESIETHPEVVATAVSWTVPIAGWGNATRSLERPDGVLPEGFDEMLAQERAVTPGFFETAGVRIVRGRGFTDADSPDGEPVVMINESFARLFFPDVDPLGETLVVRSNPRRIVGIVADVRQRGLGREVEPGFWIPFAQEHQDWLRRYAAVLVRTSGDPTAVAEHARNAVWAIDDTIPVTDMTTMDSFLVAQSRLWRLRATLLSAFASIALFLACVGIVGIMSYTVQRRIPEIGVRMALGARSQDVVRQVLAQGMRLSLIGVAIGTLGALALGRLLAGMLFEVDPTDPATLAGTAILLLLVSLTACWLPAWRASRIDPLKALRLD